MQCKDIYSRLLYARAELIEKGLLEQPQPRPEAVPPPRRKQPRYDLDDVLEGVVPPRPPKSPPISETSFQEAVAKLHWCPAGEGRRDTRALRQAIEGWGGQKESVRREINARADKLGGLTGEKDRGLLIHAVILGRAWYDLVVETPEILGDLRPGMQAGVDLSREFA